MNLPYDVAGASLQIDARADKALKLATRFWFLVAFVGLWMFALYIIAFYGGTALKGNMSSWNDALYNGLIEGDFAGNLMLVMHIFLAFVITIGGTLQLIPKLRKRAMAFHRWNGRIYIVTAFLISIAGLYMVLTRGVIGGAVMATGNTINALLIMVCAAMAWRFARVRDIGKHRRWALRTFLVVCGVWFIRIGFGIWIVLNGGSAPGSTEDLTGPFDRFLAFAHTLLPLLILEIYFRVQDQSGPKGKFAMAGAVVALSILMAAGLFMTAMIFWMPHF